MSEHTQSYFDGIASSWDDRYVRSALFRARYLEFNRIIERYSRSSWSALDYGCGTGVLTQLLQRSFGRVVATDISTKMLDVARQRFSGASTVEIVSIEEIGSRKFQLILCSSVIEYVEEPSEFLKRLVLLLKPGGVLIITFAHRYGPLQFLNRHLLNRFIRERYTDVQRHVFTRFQVEDMIRSAELEVESLKVAIGLPLIRSVGLGELLFAVARR